MRTTRTLLPALLAALLLPTGLPGQGQREESYDYWRFNRDVIRHGVQAVLMCNGLFTSNRSLEQVFDQELAYLGHPVGTARGGDYRVDRARKAVAVGEPGGTMALDRPLGLTWLPDVDAADADPRREITLRDALHMSSGLFPVDDGAGGAATEGGGR